MVRDQLERSTSPPATSRSAHSSPWTAHWQKVDKIRLLIGGETSRPTADAIAAALDQLQRSIKRAPEGGPVPDRRRGGRRGHPHRQDRDPGLRSRRSSTPRPTSPTASLEVVGSAALVGSSNFTRPGLTQNVELNVKFQGPKVETSRSGTRSTGSEAEPVNAELLTVLEHNVREFTPYEVYAKALHALTAGVDPTDKSWEESESTIYPLLAPYQKEAFHGLSEMARRWNGGFLTDGVGLGKTFVGLMLTEYYAVRQRKNVLIMATKTGQDAVWDPELRARFPHLFGEFSNVIVRAHTDFQRQDAEERSSSCASGPTS